MRILHKQQHLPPLDGPRLQEPHPFHGAGVPPDEHNGAPLVPVARRERGSAAQGAAAVAVHYNSPAARAERPQREERPRREERPQREERAQRDERPQREARPPRREDRPRRDDHDDRDSVVGFGADTPAFLLRATPRPSTTE